MIICNWKGSSCYPLRAGLEWDWLTVTRGVGGRSYQCKEWPTGKQVLPGPWHRVAQGDSPCGAPAGAVGWCLLWAGLDPPSGSCHLSSLCPWCSAGLAKALLGSKYSYSSNKSVFIISALVSKLQLWYLHSIYLNFIGVFS